MNNDEIIDLIQGGASAGAEALPKPAQRAVKTINTLIDIEQTASREGAPAKWKVSIAETGKVVAQGVVGVPLGFAVLKATVAATAVGGPGGGFVVFYNGTQATEGILDVVGENTYNEIMDVLNTKQAELMAEQSGDFLLDFRNSTFDFFSDIGSGISDFFDGLFNGGSSSEGITSQLTPRSGGNFTRNSTIDPDNIEGVIGQAIERNADSIVSKIIKDNPNMFRASVGRILAGSAQRFGDALRKGRINDLEDAFSSVFRGKNGEIGLAADIGNQVIGGLLQAGVGELLNQTRTTTNSREFDRSINANNDFRCSRSQQAAELIRIVEKGKRNT